MPILGLWRRAVQSLRLARMGLAISRAEVKRAAAAKDPASTAGAIKLRGRPAGAVGSGVGAQQLTPAQLQERIKELRQSLLKEAEQQPQTQAAQQEDAVARAAAQSEADRVAAEQLAAFNRRLDALTAEKEANYLREMQRTTRDAVLSAAAFGAHEEHQHAPQQDQDAAPTATEHEEKASRGSAQP